MLSFVCCQLQHLLQSWQKRFQFSIQALYVTSHDNIALFSLHKILVVCMRFIFYFFKAEILLFKSWSPSAWQNGGIWLREDIVCIGLSLYRCSSYGCFVKMNGTGGGEWLTGTPFVCLLLVFFEFWPSLFYFKLLSIVEVFSLLKYFSLSWL